MATVLDFRQLARLHLQRRLHHLVLHLASEASGGLPEERYLRLGREIGPLGWLDVSGGEPFARPDLPRLLSGFTSARTTVVTPVHDVDAVLRGARALQAARPEGLVLALQLDGLVATQDRLHGAGSWDRVWEAFDGLRALSGLRVEVRTHVRPENIDELVALVEYVRTQLPDGHSLGLASLASLDAVFARRLRQVEGALFAVLQRYPAEPGAIPGLAREVERLKWTTGLKTLEDGRQVIPCLAGLSQAVVRANGDVASCDSLPPVGSIVSLAWGEVWAGRGLDAQREYIKAGGCHCTDECALHDSVLLRPAHLPRLLGGTGA